LALGGVALAILGWAGMASALPLSGEVLVVGGVLQMLAACLFAVLIGDLLR
jgi:predicted phage tail protein